MHWKDDDSPVLLTSKKYSMAFRPPFSSTTKKILHSNIKFVDQIKCTNWCIHRTPACFTLETPQNPLGGSVWTPCKHPIGTGAVLFHRRNATGTSPRSAQGPEDLVRGYSVKLTPVVFTMRLLTADRMMRSRPLIGLRLKLCGQTTSQL